MRKIFSSLILLLLVTFFLNSAFAQNYSISGKIKNAETGEPVSNAKINLTPGTIGTTSDATGYYELKNLSDGNYAMKVSYIGYETFIKDISLKGDLVINVDLKSGGITTDIIEINRARDRETPVAFTDIDKSKIEKVISGQDAPMLVRGTPGLYTYSTDGVGNGEGQLLVRGFSQNYVQVLINGIPTNDPESNSVYWSNWGAVSSNASSIQIQRGAGSSLYGSGSFGGSFNILTESALPNGYYGLNLNLGNPMNTLYGFTANTGLIKNKFSGTLNIDRKIAEGTRVSGRYEGTNYYTSLAFFPTTKQSVKVVLHGAPQEHGYSWSNDVIYFKKFGYKANPAPFIPKSVVEQLPANKTNGLPNYGLLDDSRELVDNNFVNLSHNFFHKPQGELHYTYEFSPQTMLNSTLFYSMGRGAGSSINSAGTMFSFKRANTGNNGTSIDTILTNYYNTEGYIGDSASANIYLKNAFQRISYSFHQQLGVLASIQTKVNKDFNITAGAEFRNWKADHPGHFTNLFGKTTVNQTYAAVKRNWNNTADTLGTFSRPVYQGDLEGPESDVGNIFGWNLSSTDNTYKTQYRNYVGETPQYTLFAQGNYQIKNLNIMGSLQYVWYKYKLTENMPSENAIGKQDVTTQDSTEGLHSNGKFYMKGADKKLYAFDLINSERSRGFWQPKIGLNYNLTDKFNVFGNFAHVERFVDLGIYYNQGRLNDEAEDEKSNQYELGLGYNDQVLFFKINGYYMDWQNKSTRITDVSKAGQPGYDRNGNISLLVGTSRHMGVEMETNALLDKWLPFKGLKLSGSFTLMDNKWISVLDNVKVDPITGKRTVFNSSSRNSSGNIDTLYFDELEDTPIASGPQLMFNVGLDYTFNEFFAGASVNFFSKNYLLDGGTYTATDAELLSTTPAGKEVWKSTYDNTLQSAATVDFFAGYNYNFAKYLKGTITFQVLNIFNTEYFAAADRNGPIPGMLRTFRLNTSLGF
jgi:outer membrane receptor protein involved in Fe transport